MLEHNLRYLEINGINLIILFELLAVQESFHEIRDLRKLTRDTEITNLKPRNMMNRFHKN